MFVRRIFYHWQFIAVLVLPAWLLVGASLFRSSGWAVLGSFFGGILLGFGLLVVALITYARSEVRAERAVSWADVAVLTLWHAVIISLGFTEGSTGLPVLVVIAGLAVFWFGVWELYDSTRRRLRSLLVVIDETARTGTAHLPGADGHPPVPGFNATPDPSIIVVREKPNEP